MKILKLNFPNAAKLSRTEMKNIKGAGTGASGNVCPVTCLDGGNYLGIVHSYRGCDDALMNCLLRYNSELQYEISYECIPESCFNA